MPLLQWGECPPTPATLRQKLELQPASRVAPLYLKHPREVIVSYASRRISSPLRSLILAPSPIIYHQEETNQFFGLPAFASALLVRVQPPWSPSKTQQSLCCANPRKIPKSGRSSRSSFLMCLQRRRAPGPVTFRLVLPPFELLQSRQQAILPAAVWRHVLPASHQNQARR